MKFSLFFRSKYYASVTKPQHRLSEAHLCVGISTPGCASLHLGFSIIPPLRGSVDALMLGGLAAKDEGEDVFEGDVFAFGAGGGEAVELGDTLDDAFLPGGVLLGVAVVAVDVAHAFYG